MLTTTVRRTEEDLQREIQRLCDRIAQVAESARSTSQSAISYLNQVLRDRRDELAILRHSRYH